MFGMLLSIVVASVLGSLHCAAMCGAIATVVGTAHGEGGRWRRLLAYHGGRGLAYVGLGAIAGTAGAGIDRAALATSGAHDVARIAMGATLLIFALRPLFARWRARSGTVPLRRGPARTAGWLARALANRRGPGCASVGLLTGAMPCGWLWSFALAAAATASPGTGALVMLAFWLGTLPSLLGVGAIAAVVGPRLGRHAPTLTAIVLVLVAIATMAGAIGPGAGADDEEAPCCHHE